MHFAAPPTLGADMQAGITVAALLVPQAIAYALLAGLPPQVGLAAATVPLLAYAAFGRSAHLAVGPVALVSLLTATGLADAGADDLVAAAAMLAILVAAIHGLGAAFGLGRLANQIAPGAMAGFTSAAALLIGFAQLANLTGASLDRAGTIGDHLTNLPDAAANLAPATLLLSLASIAALVALRRTRLPGALLLVLATTGLSAAVGGDLWASVGEIPRALPTPGWPGFDLTLAFKLLPTAVMITLIGSLESFAVVGRYARPGSELAPNRELAALGFANLAAGFFGGYPVTGGLSRTAVNASAGAQTRLAGAVAAIGVLVTTAFLTPLLSSLPKAALGAIIVVAVAGMIDITSGLAHLRGSTRLPFAVSLLATAILGVNVGLVAIVVVSVLWARNAREDHTSDAPHPPALSHSTHTKA